MARYFAEFGHVAVQPGELVYLEVASEEPPGKPIVACRKVQVALELAAPENREVCCGSGGWRRCASSVWLVWPARRRCRAGPGSPTPFVTDVLSRLRRVADHPHQRPRLVPRRDTHTGTVMPPVPDA
jgi:hypothetical protein